MMVLPWHNGLYNWYPFKIDALGLVTLLGAEEINCSLGRLVPSRYLEYLPLLGAYVIAGERFKEKKPSFNFYNITDGINTTDLSFWLTRWMLEQEFEMTRSIVYFEVADEPRSWLKWHIVAAALSISLIGFLVAMTVLIGDWYGLANASAMIISVLVRAYSMQAHRNAIDQAVVDARNDTVGSGRPTDKVSTCVIIMSDSKAITVLLPSYLIVPAFVYNPEPAQSVIYHLVRSIGWIVFGVHIVTIGMTQLVPQIYTVALLVIPTVLICWKLGCDDSKLKANFERRVSRRTATPVEYECWIGSRLKATVFEWPVSVEFEFREDEFDLDNERKGRWVRRPADAIMSSSRRSKRRMDLFAWLNLSEEEEASLGKWDLLPHRRNFTKNWWRDYRAKKALITDRPDSMAKAYTRARAAAHDKEDKGKGPSSTISGQLRPHITSSSWSNTWLTSNGFVASNSPIATAFLSAGMGATGPGLNPDNIDLERFPLRRERSVG